MPYKDFEKRRACQKMRYYRLKENDPEKWRSRWNYKIAKEHKKVYLRETLHGRFLSYRGSAKNRKIDFLLTKEEFSKFWQVPCLYCGISIKTIGLDRIDSLKGYEIGNVVSCCTACNRMKNNHSQVYFIEHCKRITSYYGSKVPRKN